MLYLIVVLIYSLIVKTTAPYEEEARVKNWISGLIFGFQEFSRIFNQKSYL